MTRGRRLEPLDETVLAEPASGALDRMEAEELHHWIWRAIRTLPEQERIAITLHYIGDVTHEAVADFLGVRPATVNNRLRSARKKLKGRIESMAKESLRTKAPSKTDDFANAVGICYAAQSGDTDSLARILEAAPDLIDAEHPHIQGKARQTAVHFAAREGRLKPSSCCWQQAPIRSEDFSTTTPCLRAIARS